MIELTVQDYAKADLLVTNKSQLAGEPTLPLGLVLNFADEQADHEDEDIYEDWLR